MRVIVNLMGHDVVTHHVRVIHSCGSGLLIDRVVIAVGLGVSVTRHVPHVGNASRRLSEAGGGRQGAFRSLTIP